MYAYKYRCPWRPEEMLELLELELKAVINSAQYGCWKLNSGSLQEQYMLLTTEQSF